MQRTIQRLKALIHIERVKQVQKLAYLCLRICNRIVLGKILVLGLRKVIFSLPLVKLFHVCLMAVFKFVDALFYPGRAFRERFQLFCCRDTKVP